MDKKDDIIMENGKHKEKKDYKENKERMSKILKEFRKDLAKGANTLGHISADLFEDVKEKAEHLYEKSSEKFEQASGVIQNYIEKYKGEEEIKTLSQRKKELSASFGDEVFNEFKKNGAISKRFLATIRMTALFHNIEKVDKDILRIGKDLESRDSKK